MKIRTLIASLVAALLTIMMISSAPAYAHQSSSPAPSAGAIPSAVPSAITPNIDNGSVQSIAQVGNTVVMAGDFTSIGGVTRHYLAAINATTGALSTTFDPEPDGAVYSVVPGPNDHTVYVGGAFSNIAGSASQFVAEIDVNTGALVSQFKAPKFDYGKVNDIKLVGSRLYVAGFFGHVGGAAHMGIAALNATTGAVDPFMNVQFSGHHNDSGSGAQGYIGPWAFDVSPDGTRMVVIGNFKYADGLLREQVVMIDLDGSSAQVDPNWATDRYAPLCYSWAFDGYVRGVSFSPDGSYFVINATGGGNAGTLCDATARWETSATGTDVQPTWVDETGGDTVWGVTVTDDAVYIGGHNRWNNNPLGVDHAQAGAVPRPGLAALDPVSGRPYTWNPGHNPLGAAVYALLATPQGLWMGYDANWIGNYKYKRQKIAFFPYAGGTTLASTSTAQLPANVYLGKSSGSGSTNVLYRVDAGGPAIQSLDSGPNWAADESSSDPGATYHNAGSNTAQYSPVTTVDSTVPATTPSAIFDSERWSPSDTPPMTWDFPVASGTNVEVRLYFANRCSCTSAVGSRKFNVSLNGQSVLSNYDIVADVGDQTGTMKAYDITVPSSGTYAGDVDLTFTHDVENPLINGIEIINKDAPAPPTSGDGSLSAIGFNGTSATAAQDVDTGGIDWSDVRGAFMVGNYVYYGYTDGYLHRVTFTKSGFGTPEKVDPYHDPVWDGVDTHDGTTFDGAFPSLYAQIPNITGMFYSGGRLYYTLFGDSNLYSRWFSPDSGIVDETTATSASSVSFSNADGMFVSGGNLYYATNDGNLNKVAFNNGTVSGSSTVVSGPSTDGVNWTNRALFLSSVGATAANQPPSAAFTSSCSGGGCSFDGSGSSDPDGTIASYSWDFGDGSDAGSGVSPSHTYTSAGTYTVSLTVKDNSGATDTVSHSVTVSAAPASDVSYVGSSHSAIGATKSKQVTVPASAQVGDTMVLYLTQGNTATWSSPPSGWTQLDSFTNATVTSTAWVKSVAAGDPGSSVSVTSPSNNKAMLTLAVYRGVDTSAVTGSAVAHAGDSGGLTHTTPTLSTSPGDWVVSYWADKSGSSDTTSWTAPDGVTTRDTATGTGTGRYDSLLADSGGSVLGGTYGGLTANSGAASDKAVMWTIDLTPED